MICIEATLYLILQRCKKITESKEEMAVAKPHVSDDEDEELFGAALKAHKAIAFILGVGVSIFDIHITIQNISVLAYAVCYKREFYIELCSLLRCCFYFSSSILHL